MQNEAITEANPNTNPTNKQARELFTPHAIPPVYIASSRSCRDILFTLMNEKGKTENISMFLKMKSKNFNNRSM